MNSTMLHDIPKRVLIVLIIAGCARLAAAFLFVDPGNKLYWEYGEIARNILAGRGYSLWYFSGDRLQYLFNPAITPFPSAYMSPGYVAFLLPFLTISQDVLRNVSLFFVQTCLSLLGLWLLYRFTARAFSERSAMIALVLAALLPDFVYAAASFTPTVLFHCFLLGLMIVLCDDGLMPANRRVVALSLLFAALAYLRFEILLFVGMVLLLQLDRGRWKEVLTVSILVIILLSPWVIRNSAALDGFVPTGTGLGLNLYRGNNPDEIGSWGSAELHEKILALPRDRSFELSLNRLYIHEVVSYVWNDPARALGALPVKFYHLWLFSPIGNRLPLVSQLTSWCVLLLFIVGFLATSSWHRYRYLYLFLFFSTMIGLLFLSLPRHQTMMRIVVLPFAASGCEYLWNRARKLRSAMAAR